MLIGELLDKPAFTVERMDNGMPAWEENLLDIREFEHEGVKFAVRGMMDGILKHSKSGKRIGFELKTKSTTLAAIGDYKLRAPQDTHMSQLTAYSMLFQLDEFVIVYKSLAKDGWMKGKEAKPDLKAFHIIITPADRVRLIGADDREQRSGGG